MNMLKENYSQEMIIDIINKDFSSAKEKFNNEMMSRISDKIDSLKIGLAQGAINKQGYSSDETDN